MVADPLVTPKLLSLWNKSGDGEDWAGLYFKQQFERLQRPEPIRFA